MGNRFPFSKSWIFLVLVFTIFASDAWAWGEEGHSIVAEIAQRRLSQNAAEAITQILRASPNATPYSTPSLASISTWADEVRYDGAKPNGTYNWHFVDIPRQDTHYDSATECPKEKPEQGDCVINELSRLRNELRCTAGDQQLRALKFAVHFVGDIHQPFHTIWENIGGNGITFTTDKLQFKGKTCSADKCSTPPDNLHKMWDTTLIRAMEYNWPTFVDDLESGWLTTDAAKNDRKDDPVAWAEDAHNAAIAFNVWVDAGATLDQAYYDRVTPLVSQQLGFAGIRLARYLNDVFSSSQCPYAPRQ
ncbi:hypothetical protein EI171_02740 [Bradyrhizobium sp. LCT2]|uniref:S1/P1 nuclease n=1 Tax=Bradyrhizobium sp. LCT2 TaxID=2493093 RepID=UPI001373D902|nr:S1/P1 nuclease [Bradyrhizobium sp. LCT2]QHP66422.1 hypothetical protein EI171_02740 [Bradyrhizobium sp. LCT2]